MKGVLAHAALALLGLFVAYRTFTRPLVEEQRPNDEVLLLACEPDALESIDFEAQTHFVHIAPERYVPEHAANGEQATAYWLTVTRKKPEKETDPKAPDAPKTPEPASTPSEASEKSAKTEATDKAAATPATPATTPEKKPARVFDPEAPVTVRASAKLDELLAAMLPLRALRALGVIPKADRKSFGLEEVNTKLRVRCGGKQLALEVGGRTFGNQDSYVRDPKTDQSYLLPSRIVTELQSAQFKLTQNELHAFPLTEVDEAVISADGKTRRLLHRDRLVKETAQWVDASAPDQRNELFGNFFDRLSRLRVRGYLGAGAAPGSDLQLPASAPKPVVAIEHKLEGKPKGKLELVRVEAGDESFFYARTESTGRWVTLYDTVVKQVAGDVGLVVSGEESAIDAPAIDAKMSSAPPAAAPH